MKKSLSIILSVLMALSVFSLMPFSVWAEEPTVVTTYDQLTTAITNGEDICLGADISTTSAIYIQKDIVLDLNGHTLNLGNSKLYVLSNSTFKDSSGNDSGKISGTGNYKIYAGLVSAGESYPGTLTVESGTYVTSGNGMLRVAACGELTMTGGFVQATQYPVYVSAAGAMFTMTGGTVKATTAVGVYTVAGSEFVMNGGTVTAPQQAITNLGNSTLNGGTVQATSQIGVYVSSGTLTLDGGTVQAPNDAINVKDNVGASVTIAGGTVTATNYTGIYAGKGDTLTVNGGTVSAGYAAITNLGDAVINGGKIVSDNADNRPTVQVKGEDETVKASLILNGGTVEALGNGAAINLHSNATLTVNGGTIKAAYPDPEEKQGGAGITAFKNTEVTVTAGSVSAFSHALAGNGSPAGEANEGTNAKFTITGGTLTSTAGAGIYAPQVNGETVITGGTITGGRTGVEIRAGSLTIEGGKISGNKEEYDCTANKNGLTTKGAAVSVCQHTTKQPIDVKISGGTFEAKLPFSEVNALENPAEDVANITYEITGGTFISTDTSSDAAAVRVEDYANGPFVSGGEYSHPVDENYIAEGYSDSFVKIVTDEGEFYTVVPLRTATLSCGENGSALIYIDVEGYGKETGSADSLEAYRGLPVKVAATPDANYQVDKITYTYGEETADITEAAGFDMPDSDATVTVTFALVEYTVTFIADGKTVKTFKLTAGAKIPVPPAPAKAGYTFKGWSPEVPAKMPAKNMTFKAVFEKKAVAKVTFEKIASVAYRTDVTITATGENLPKGTVLAIYEKGGSKPLAKGNAKSVSYKAGEMKSAKTYEVKVIDSKGNAQKGLGGEIKIDVTGTGFFQRIIAFFKYLFSPVPTKTVGPKVK
ncbi:MAG: InlB B-repeat-containing protein [Clostridia bacterium]|nr:InlB B-repeat-containing protein [Clostridia bacterium]